LCIIVNQQNINPSTYNTTTDIKVATSNADTIQLQRMLENDLQDDPSFMSPNASSSRDISVATAASMGYQKELNNSMMKPIAFRQSSRPGILTKEMFLHYIHNPLEYDQYGLLPIHKICAQFPDQSKLILTMIRSNPDTASASVRLHHKVRHSSGDQTKRIDLVDSTYCYINQMIGGVRNPSFCFQPGQCPLHIAVANKASAAVIKVLLMAAPYVLEVRDKNGMTPLMLILRFYQSLYDAEVEDKILILLSHSPQTIFISDLRSNSPLHYACMAAYGKNGGFSLDLVKYITQLNPNAVNERNFDGLTPLALAQRQGNKVDDEVIAYLQSVAYRDEDIEDAPDI